MINAGIRDILVVSRNDKEVIAYLNRLSSLLFVLSRVVNKRDGFSKKKHKALLEN